MKQKLLSLIMLFIVFLCFSSKIKASEIVEKNNEPQKIIICNSDISDSIQDDGIQLINSIQSEKDDLNMIFLNEDDASNIKKMYGTSVIMEKNYLLHASDMGIDASDQELTWNYDAIKIDNDSENISKNRVKIAIIDSGINYTPISMW